MMNQRRAFTLIELLVVIAIIAILAAILFPVFSQAKAAAKGAASLSNNKQVALAAIMYSNDSDDRMPILTNWGAPGVNNGAMVYFGGQGCIPWPQLIEPYSKSADLLLDPQAPPPPAVLPGFNPLANRYFGPMYGMNPYLAQSTTFPYGADAFLHNTRTLTSVSRPADVVMFTQKYSNSETVTNNFYGGWWYGPGTYFITVTTDPPDCAAPGNAYYCASGWNDNTFYGGNGGIKELKNIEAAGAWTGGGSMRGRRQMVAAFVDGHVASRPPAWFAEGTNYSGAKDALGVPIQNQTQIEIIDIGRDRYHGIQ